MATDLNSALGNLVNSAKDTHPEEILKFQQAARQMTNTVIAEFLQLRDFAFMVPILAAFNPSNSNSSVDNQALSSTAALPAGFLTSIGTQPTAAYIPISQIEYNQSESQGIELKQFSSMSL